VTKFSVRPARLGWVYEFEGGRARGAGWRFTRDAAKRAGQRKAGELADHPVALRPQPTQSTRFGALGSVVDSSPHAPRQEGVRPEPRKIEPRMVRDAPRGRANRRARGGVIVGAGVLVMALLLGGLAWRARSSGVTGTTATSTPSSGLRILATDRLQAAMPAVIDAFRADHPEVNVTMSFSGADDMAKAIDTSPDVNVVIGNATDLRKSASVRNKRLAVENFGNDAIEVVARTKGPLGIENVSEFRPDSAVRTAICVANTICGAGGRQAVGALGFDPSAFPTEPSADALLAKLRDGGIDAGMVYRTEWATSGSDLARLPLPDDLVPSVVYQLVRPHGSPSADQFVAFLSGSSRASDTLKRAGLLAG